MSTIPEDVGPFLERRALLVLSVTVVDGRHGAMRHAAMIEHVGDVEPSDAGFADVRAAVQRRSCARNRKVTLARAGGLAFRT